MRNLENTAASFRLALAGTRGNPLEHLTLTDSSMYGPPRMLSLELRYAVSGGP